MPKKKLLGKMLKSKAFAVIVGASAAIVAGLPSVAPTISNFYCEVVTCHSLEVNEIVAPTEL